jgi:predicted ArsR family transcriptional regulator
MANDPVAEHVGWLDGIMTHPDNAGLFAGGKRSAVQKELAGRWTGENRLGLLNDLADRFGEAEVSAVLDAVIAANCRRDWERIGKESGDNSLDAFIRQLWGPLKDAGFEYAMEKTGRVTKFCVTRCPMYDLAKSLGAEKWFYHLVCLTDEHTVTGFNPRIKFSRTRTLMQGNPDCDHCYTDTSA